MKIQLSYLMTMIVLEFLFLLLIHSIHMLTYIMCIYYAAEKRKFLFIDFCCRFLKIEKSVFVYVQHINTCNRNVYYSLPAIYRPVSAFSLFGKNETIRMSRLRLNFTKLQEIIKNDTKIYTKLHTIKNLEHDCKRKSLPPIYSNYTKFETAGKSKLSDFFWKFLLNLGNNQILHIP